MLLLCSPLLPDTATEVVLERLTMVMSRALYSATLLLVALAGPVSSTPEIPTEFFEAQNRAGADGRFALRRAHFEERFRSWMAEHGVTFGTKGEFERRLRIFAENRYCRANRESERVGDLPSALVLFDHVPARPVLKLS